MSLTEEQVKHIAHLARLKLSDEEIKKYGTQLTDILGWIDMLDEVNVEAVEETSQVTGLESVMREDEVVTELAGREELLACSELPIERKQVKVKVVL